MDPLRWEASSHFADGPHVLASAADGVDTLIRELGGDVDTIFGRAGLDRSAVGNPLNEIDLGRYCALFEEAASQTQCDNFGLRFGHRFKPKQLGAIGYLAINSPTISAALGVLCDYFPAHQEHSTLRLRDEGDLLFLHYQINAGSIRRRRQDAELSLGMFCNIIRHSLGPRWSPVEIHFEHPRPLYAKEHEILLDAPVFFSQPINAIAFRRAELDRIMPDPDPHLFGLIEPFMRARKLRSPAEDVVAQVRRQIEKCLPDGDPGIDKIAANLSTKSWTLHRRLRELDTSFHNLLRDTRRDLALRHLCDHDASLTEVAFLLGYSELSAFSRAFRQWTGMAPARYRREIRAQQGRQRPPI
jgi:AraC-like DNA-binding protein